MGMAASQARYLALTARKTNTEWEGQQINQARTALANQSANLFNRLLDLKVPNPPKTTDYTEIQYSYSDGQNESVIDSWQQLSNADPDYNYIVKHYYYADIFTGGQKLLQDPQVQLGDVLKEITYHKETADISYGNNQVTVKYKIPTEEEQTALTYDKLTEGDLDRQGLRKALTDFATAKNIAINEAGLPVQDSVYFREDTDGTWHFFLANIQDETYNHITQDMVNTDVNLRNYLKANGYLDEFDQLTANNIYGQDETVDEKTIWKFIEYGDGVNPDPVHHVYTGNAIDNKDYSMAYNVPAYVGNCKLTELSELIVNDEIDQVAELAQILRDLPDSSVKNHISFDATGNNLIYEGSGIYTFDLYGKTYYTTREDLDNSIGTPYEQKKPIELQDKLPYYNATSVRKRIEETNHALLETDGNGRFKSVKFDNDSVVYTLNTETVTNEAAYEDAMNKYLYEKAKYEKTIADINAKTSIIQKEDRTLELRLKQLDTEQLALKTEMDAVQKVIKENVEKTFKTFSD